VRVSDRGDDAQPAPAPAAVSPARPSGSREIERLVVRSAVRVILVGIAAFIVVTLFWRLRLLVILAFVSLFLAALLHPATLVLTRRGLRRGTAVATVYLVVLLLAVGVGYLLFHPVYASATRFAKDLPHLVTQAQQGKGQIGRIIERLHLASYVKTHAPKLESVISNLGKPALAVGKTVLSGVVSLVTVAVLTFFLLLHAPSLLRAGFSLLSPGRAALARRVAEDMARQVTGYMLGNFATSVIAGIVVFVTLQVTGVPFASVLALWVALVDFLPLIGGLLAGVPTVGLAFLHSVTAGIAAVIVFLVYQQLENHVLMPVIVSRTVRLNAFFVLVAVLLGAEIGGVVGSTFGGLVGAILAVPAAGGVQVAARAVFSARRSGTALGAQAPSP